MNSQHGLEHACEGGCLRIRLHNDDIVRKMEPTVRQILALIEQHAPKVTLIDFRGVPAATSFAERYSLGEMAGRHLPGRFVAALTRPEQADRGQIGKVVANNRGALVEVFTDEAAAEVWVRAKLPPPRPSA